MICVACLGRIPLFEADLYKTPELLDASAENGNQIVSIKHDRQV